MGCGQSSAVGTVPAGPSLPVPVVGNPNYPVLPNRPPSKSPARSRSSSRRSSNNDSKSKLYKIEESAPISPTPVIPAPSNLRMVNVPSSEVDLSPQRTEAAVAPQTPPVASPARSARSATPQATQGDSSPPTTGQSPANSPGTSHDQSASGYSEDAPPPPYGHDKPEVASSPRPHERIRRLSKEDEGQINVGQSNMLNSTSSALFVSELRNGKLEDSYRIGKALGKGSYGTVHQCKNRETNLVYAVKRVPKSALSNPLRLINEVVIMSECRHPNIVSIQDVFETPDSVFLVMQYCRGGDLFHRIKRYHARGFSESTCTHLVRCMLKGLQYLHDRGVIHRDLKPENILFVEPPSGTESDFTAEIKIADFGLATTAPVCQTVCGSAAYIAPEVMQMFPYGAKADIWSLGVITYILLCGFPPFAGATIKALYKNVTTANFQFMSPYWDGLSDDSKDFIRACLTADPSKRITAPEGLQHPWLTANLPPVPIPNHEANWISFENHRTSTIRLPLKLDEED